ncbi:hypothetical protein EVG20_g1506 [Dentipellis fragilis]|uniref:Uncharacterized protein n=1 Tax=Dentipellis fragilis TaxID=205917 RepID=A0A4Y9Z9G4_9AGAM|nr:hypothetical protein EVG20_g1506 [Dentipellis fragilis]
MARACRGANDGDDAPVLENARIDGGEQRAVAHSAAAQRLGTRSHLAGFQGEGANVGELSGGRRETPDRVGHGRGGAVRENPMRRGGGSMDTGRGGGGGRGGLGGRMPNASVRPTFDNRPSGTYTLLVSCRSLISLLAAMDSFHGPQQATRPIKLNVIRDAADAPQSDAPRLRPKWSLAARQMPP